MSTHQCELIGRAEEAASRGDLSLLAELLAEDVEFRTPTSGPNPQVIWIGRDEVLRQIADEEGRPGQGWKVDGVRDHGDHVLVLCQEWREVSGSDLRVTHQSVTRYRFAGDRVDLVEQFWSLEEALAAMP